MGPCLKALLEARGKAVIPADASQGRSRYTWVDGAVGYTGRKHQFQDSEGAHAPLRDSVRRLPRPGASGGRGTRHTNLAIPPFWTSEGLVGA